MTGSFDDLKRYVGFGEADEAALSRLAPALAPHLERLAERFGERALADPTSRRLLEAAEGGVPRHRERLVEWLTSAIAGPHDAPLFERRARIGRAHVRVGLPQHFMLTAMNGLRLDLRDVVDEIYATDDAARRAAGDALDRLLDLELAAMLHAYAADSEDRVRRNERLAVTGRFAGSLAHELRQPLAVVDTSLHLLRRRLEGVEAAARHLDRIEAQVRAAAGILTDLVELTRDAPPARSMVEVERLVDEALASLRLPEGVAVERALAPGARVHVQPVLAVRALVNVLQNAAAALTARGGTVRVESVVDGAEVAVSVVDDGPGFDPEVLPDAFEPLVTTRAGGTGLGLALVQRVCERHGGRAEARNVPGGGARVTLRLPAAPPLA